MYTVSRPHLPILLGCALLLSGCAMSPDKPQGEGAEIVSLVDEPATPEQQLLQLMGTAASGEVILLRDGVSARLDSLYTAASGRNCRPARLQFADGRTQRQLACETGGGWEWVPGVLPNAAR